MSIESAHALDLQNVSYTYRGNWLLSRRTALKNISLTVDRGESFGFLGHNGAGKTTAIKAILGITRVRQGKISIFGLDNTDIRARELVGYLPEYPYFYDHLSVEELLSMYATLAGIPSAQIPAARTRALELVKLSGRTKSPLRSLSKGLMQRVGMAQAIIAQPKLLILDEPFSGLDPIGRKDFRELLVLLKGEGTTIFMSSHILSDVEFLCERVSIMSKGEIKGIYRVSDIPSLSAARFELIIEDSPGSQQLLQNIPQSTQQQNGRLVTLFDTREQAEATLKRALEAQLRIDSFSVVQNSLEDVFVKLVQFDESGKQG